MTTPIDLSVVIPAYDEAGRIGPTLDRLVAALDRCRSRGRSWWPTRSTDDTAAIVAATADREPRVRVLRLPHRGKGATLRDGLLAAIGARRFLCDADLSMPPAQITRFLDVLPSQCDIAIGSREGAGAVRVGEPLHRHLLGRVFNVLVRVMVRVLLIQDTPGGFKLFTAEAVDRCCRPPRSTAGASTSSCSPAPGPGLADPRGADRVALWPGVAAAGAAALVRDAARPLPHPGKVRRGAFARPAAPPPRAARLTGREPAHVACRQRVLCDCCFVLLLAAITLGARRRRRG